jgi:general secretion pathway protein C
MGVDAYIKRFFPWIVALLLAIAAWFQAAGMGQLVGATIAAGVLPSDSGLAHARRVALPSSDDPHTTSCLAILERNPFDSATGPLLEGTAINVPPAKSLEVVDDNPYKDPTCEGAKVLILVASDEPEWSFAAIVGSDGKAAFHRQGDSTPGGEVFFIGDRRDAESRANGPGGVWDRVWLTTSSGHCQMGLGGKLPAAAKPAAKPKGDDVPDAILKGIHKKSETESDVDRAALEAILENPTGLMKSVRVVPEKKGDKVVGLRLFGIKDDSVLGALGVQNNDQLQSINGFDMADPQKALEAYTRLRTADALTVTIERHGQPMTLSVNIK